MRKLDRYSLKLFDHDYVRSIIKELYDDITYIGYLPFDNQKERALFLVFCNKCGTFSFKREIFLRKYTACKKCSRLNRIGKHLADKASINRQGFHRHTFESATERAKSVHGDRYEYLDILTGEDGRIRLRFKCKRCNKISIQYIHNHVRGCGCSCYSYEKQYGKLKE